MLHSVSGYVKLTARTATYDNHQRFSEQGAVLDGNKASKVVPRPLLLFFRTLICGFQLQHGGHPPSGARQPAAVVQQMGHYEQLRRVHSRWPVPVPRALAGGLFSSGTFFLEFVGGSIWCALGTHARHSLARCLC